MSTTMNINNKEEATKKRTRATAEQLAILEDTFAVNVSPNSKLRKQLADQLKMTDRSIQIWFQNRRAKVKHLQKKAQLQMHQAHMRAQLYLYQQQHYYLQQQFAPHQRAHSMDSYHHQNNHSLQPSSSYHHLYDDRQSSMPPPNLLLPFHISNPTSNDLTSDHAESYRTSTINTSSSTTSSPLSSSLSPSLKQTNPLELTSKDLSIHVTSLTIGKWHRMKMQENDLTCIYQPEKQSLCWFIIDGDHQFKIEILTSTIQQFIYYHSTSSNQVLGEIQLDLLSSPVFYMKQQQEWTSCSDFTEHQQASKILKHSLKGMNLNLWQDLTHLITTYPETSKWIQIIPSQHPSLLSSSLSTSSNEDDDTTNHLLLTSSSMNPTTTTSTTYQHDSFNILPLTTTTNTNSMNLPSLNMNEMDSSLYYLTKNNNSLSNSIHSNGIHDLEPFITNDDYLTTDPSLLDPSLWATTLNY